MLGVLAMAGTGRMELSVWLVRGVASHALGPMITSAVPVWSTTFMGIALMNVHSGISETWRIAL